MTRTRARARIGKVLTATGLTAISLAGLNAQAAGAEEPGAQPPIVHDEGLDAQPRADSTPDVFCNQGTEIAADEPART